MLDAYREKTSLEVGMRFYKDNLAPGWQYPCSIRELKEYLGYLPPVDVARVYSIRLSTERKHEDALLIDGNRIVLLYVVDKNYTKDYIGYPTDEMVAEWRRFGAIFTHVNGRGKVKGQISWDDPNHLKRYIRFIMFHEIGHIVYSRRYGWHGGFHKAQEKFCDDYAYKYLDAMRYLASVSTQTR